MIADSSGEYTHYGKLKNLVNPEDASGTVEIDLSTVGDMTGKTLYVFNEQDNGDKKTDYASELKTVRMEPDVYTISIEGEGDNPGDFGTVQAGYDVPEARTFSITNTGNRRIENIAVGFMEANASFVLDTGSTATSLEPGEKTTFTVQPAAGLEGRAVPYEATVEVIGTNMAQAATQKMTFEVTAAAGTSGTDTPGANTPGSNTGLNPTARAQAAVVPQTGDSNLISLWFVLLFLSLAGVGGTVLYGRKRKR